MSKTSYSIGKARSGYHPGFGDWGGGPDPVVGRHQRSRLNGKSQGRVPPVWMFANAFGNSKASKRMNKTTYVMKWKLKKGVPYAKGINKTSTMFTTWYQHPAAETTHFVPSKGFYNFNGGNDRNFAK